MGYAMREITNDQQQTTNDLLNVYLKQRGFGFLVKRVKAKNYFGNLCFVVRIL